MPDLRNIALNREFGCSELVLRMWQAYAATIDPSYFQIAKDVYDYGEKQFSSYYTKLLTQDVITFLCPNDATACG